jgi:hypothetical protein
LVCCRAFLDKVHKVHPKNISGYFSARESAPRANLESF